MNRDFLQVLARGWRQTILGRDLTYALGAGCLAIIPMVLFPAASWPAWLMAAGFGGTLLVRLALSRPWLIDPARVAGHLDRTYREMEESGSLFLRQPEDLTRLERMQMRRVGEAVASQSSRPPKLGDFGMPPRHFLSVVLCYAACVILAVFGTGLWLKFHPRETLRHPHAARANPSGQSTPRPAATEWPRITGGGVTIRPPAYTAHPPRRVEGFNADVEEGATVTWTLALDRPVREARLVFGEGPAGTLALEVRPDGTGVELSGARRIADAGLYHLAATLPGSAAWNPPELFALKMIKDRPPTVRIVRPALARTEVAPTLPPAAPPHLEVEIEASDDYGIADIRIIATVAKGSGEAVKFREVPLAFDTDTALPDGVTRRLTRTLDLGTLSLEPGDELYFFVQAYDNRQPTGNRTRSETRFITLQGPQGKTSVTGKGMTGVNLVPQYFRSERQIIIDTEKLIADRPGIADGEFRERANSLGIDQQLLRLRYGQLLGEELEGGNGDHAEVSLDPLQRTVPTRPAGPRAAASVTQRFVQEHAAQDRQGGTAEEREAGARPDHPDKPLSAGEVVAPFVDQHDSQDKSTYFDGGTKDTMHDALAAMWDAEKFLRTARPEEALAPEHRALDILKDLQQSARAYVQHVGFEAPPLRVNERRLAGDAGDVPARGSVTDTLPPGDPGARAARAALGMLPSTSNSVVGEKTLTALRQVEPALTAAATRQPEVFLPGLQTLRRVVAGNGRAEEDFSDLRRALWRLLPPARPLPDQTAETDPSLAESYFRALQPPVNPEGRP